MSDSDAPVPAGRASGDPPDLPKLLEVYGPVWLAMALNYCGDHQFGEDALWEAVHALSRELAAGKVDNPSAWMATTLRNRASKRMRNEAGQQRARAGLSNLAPASLGYDDNSANESPVTGEPFAIEERHWDAVRAALPNLPPRQRKVIELRLFEKLSTAEIAVWLEISEGAVHAAQYNAVLALRKLCGPARGDDSGP